jgi:hypothetical protein
VTPYTDFNQTYGLGQWYAGNYSTEVFNINGVSFPNFTFILMKYPQFNGPEQEFGVSSLGLGAKLDEVGISSETEPTLLSYAVDKGMIQTTAYSFWFDDPSDEAPTGQVLLGGIDTGKFHGGLVTLDTTLSSDKSFAITELTVALTSLSTSPNGSLSHQIPLASTNAPLVYPWAGPMTLPSDIVPGIWTALGATFDINVEPYLAWPIVDCSYTTNSSTFNLHFGSDLVVPINISDLTVHNGTGTDNQDGPNGAYCRLDILAASDNNTLSNAIGSAALKQIYTVFDLNLNQVSIALRNASSTVTNIVEIGPLGVPALNLNNQTATPTPSPAATSHTLTIALGVAIPVGIILIVGIVTGFFFFRRRNRRNALPGTAPDPHLSYLHSEDKPVTGPEKPELDASPGPKYTISTPGSPPVAILGAPDTLEAPSELPDNSACYSELSGVSGGTFQAYIPSR